MHVTLRTPNFATSAQVQTSQFSDLAKGGFMVIVNDRPDRESDDQPLSSELAGEAKRQGLGYAYIPIVPGEISDCDAREFGDVLCAASRPAPACCRTGNQSQKLWKRAALLGLLPH